MTITLTPSPLRGTVPAIPSKSEAHRCFILAALSDKPTKIILNSTSEDIEATISCLQALGAAISRKGVAYTVEPVSSFSLSPLLDCRESGSTIRFLLPVASAVCSSASFSGRGRLPQRPLFDLVSAMSEHGVSFSCPSLPLSISGRLRPGTYHIAGDISSQYITGLLMALPLLDGDSRIIPKTPFKSIGYINITINALKKFGIEISESNGGYFIRGNQKPISPGTITIEGDWSNASFFLAAGAISGSVTVEGVSARSLQGDKAICDILKRFGADVITSENSVTVTGRHLTGCDIDVTDIPDALPVLASVAAAADGVTHFRGGSRLIFKESDRLSATAAMLRSLGGDASETDDGLTVRRSTLTGGTADSFGDHRIAMAAAVASCACTGNVTICGAEATGKSYPDFWTDFEKVGGIISDRR